MDGNVEEIQDELKVLKNEIQETLTDIRDHLLTSVENPFPIELAPGGPSRQRTESEPARPADKGEDRADASRGFFPGLGQGMPGGQMDGGTVPQVAAAGPVIAGAPQFINPGGGAGLVSALGLSGVGPAVTGAEPVAIEGPAPAAKPAPPEPQGQAHTPGGNGSGPAAAREAATKPQEPANIPQDTPEDTTEKTPELKKPEASVAERPEPEHVKDRKSSAQDMGKVVDAGQDVPTDLVTVAILAPWMEDGIRKIGKERLKAIVDIYYSMGGLPEQLKEVLAQLIGLDSGKGAETSASLKDCLRILADLDNLVWRSRMDRSGAAMLSVLLNGKQPVAPSTRGSY